MVVFKPVNFVLLSFVIVAFAVSAFAQSRPRVVGAGGEEVQNPAVIETQKAPQAPAAKPRPTLSNPIVVNSPSPSLIKKTGSSAPVNAPANNQAASMFAQRLMSAMRSRLGIRYRYGSDGPNSYDCSGLVWSVFSEAGMPITRTSAASYWRTFEPVYGDDRFKFGTLVFFNKLGHVGIVIDENTFFQASSSKGVTFSPFAGYWEKRIVGFRRIPNNF